MFTKQPFQKVQMFKVIPAQRRGGFQGGLGLRTQYLMEIEEESLKTENLLQLH
jgi:hypothetical protein